MRGVAGVSLAIVTSLRTDLQIIFSSFPWAFLVSVELKAQETAVAVA